MTQLPGIAGEIERVIGLDLAVRLLQRRGGCELHIPRRARGSFLAEIVGEDAAAKLAEAIGPGKIVLPCAHLRGQFARREEAKAMLRDGASLQQVALACDMHTRTVSRLRAEIEAEAGSRQPKLPFDRP
ncbi:hypothetical protein ROE7235_03738 [Roseibaca ekhonensis]|uniref:Mor transcription activator domain-containing protein n=1 Tax=Roseinatronobacter ekhonensis TaxID=254356 RepID=A0A3B0MSE1_9RHOB|nr:hypothetical protein [Roseibaca ekhonensis]SUZ33957.1 hypothetical protein ROE7235_03738 [Roseibaca ekhonensis]